MADRCFSIIDCAQRSPEWIAARLGRLTASHAGEMLAKRKDKTEAAGRRNLRLQLILERLTGKPQESTYQSDAMLTGIEREADAIAAYEAEHGCIIEATGFLSHNTLMVGASLDGHIGDFDVLVSIKCRQPAAHWDFLRSGIVPSDAISQMRHEAWLCRDTFREHHYVSWQPDFPEGKQLRVAVYTPPMLDIAEYEAEALRFLNEIDQELKAVEGWNVLKHEAEAGVAL